MEHRRIKLAAALAAVCVLGVGAVAMADNGRRNFKEVLTGFEEVPALSTPGIGEFRASINRDGEIEWTLNFSGLETDVTQAHIHFENATNNGNVIVFLCSNCTATTCARSRRTDGRSRQRHHAEHFGETIGSGQTQDYLLAWTDQDNWNSSSSTVPERRRQRSTTAT